MEFNKNRNKEMKVIANLLGKIGALYRMPYASIEEWIWDEVPSYQQIIGYIKIFLIIYTYIYIFITI